ncbi:MAG: hypothetical protein ABW146_05330 [Candidatus Sedimenticola sp. 6PFRAG7]
MIITIRIFLVAILAASIVTGCSSVPVGSPPTMSLPSDPIATRSLLVRPDAPDDRFRVKGFVVFNARPITPMQHNRYLVACEAYMATLEGTDSYPDHLDLLPTYWPIEKKLEIETCREMLDKYDYVRASQLRAKYRTAIGPGEGPFLLAAGSGEVMIFDMSTFSDADVYRAMRIWKEQICVNPENWEPKLSLVKFREAFRSMLQAYGESILKYFG